MRFVALPWLFLQLAWGAWRIRRLRRQLEREAVEQVGAWLRETKGQR